MHDFDKGLSVTFFLHPKLNPRKSKDAGRDVFDQVEMISIAAPGNRNAIFTAFADRQHWDANTQQQLTYAERFPELYEQFKQGVKDQIVGTPIPHANFLNEAEKAEVMAKHIRSVEQLASVQTKDIGKRDQNFQRYVNDAKAFLSAGTEGAALKRELEQLRAEMAALKGKPEDAVPDGYAHFEDEDLRGMLRDAGVPLQGNPGRKKLIEKLEELKASEAA